MKIEQTYIEDIKPYINNPRHNENAIEAVANSIREFGFKVPIIIDKNYVIVAGHTRWKAAELLGMETVPTIMADDLTPKQIKAFRLADNKVAEIAEWDFTKLQVELENLDFDMEQFGFEYDELFPQEKEVVEDDYDVEGNIKEDNFSQMGDIYILGRHRLMYGDSTLKEDVEKLVGDKEIDLLQTDPPYNVNYGSKAEAINKYGYRFNDRHIKNDYMPSAEFVEFLTKAFENAVRHMREGASFYIWHASTTVLEFELALRYNNLQTRQQLIWNKNALVLSRQDYHWKHEPCLYGWKEGAAHYFINDRTQTTTYDDEPLDFKKMKKQDLVKLVEKAFQNFEKTTVVDHDKPSRSEEHPTMKPIKLIAYQIGNSTKENENVLDLFGGSGSTLIASEQIDRNAYLMEYDGRFVDVIVKRYYNLTSDDNITLIRDGKEIPFTDFRDELDL